MANVFDIFNDDAFSAVTLSDRAQDHVQKRDYVPMLLDSLGIFEPQPIRTETFAIENRDGVLRIIQTSERAEPLPQYEKIKRGLRDFRTVRLAKGGVIRAHEIQNIRKFASNELQALTEELDNMVYGAGGLMDDMMATWERHRLGAVQGVVQDADDSTIINWYTEWGITQADEIDFALGTAATNVRAKCAQVRRQMQRAAKGAWRPGVEVVGLCSDTFWDSLVDHAKVRDTYLNWQDAATMRGATDFSEFRFGGIRFINYQGTDDESTISIADGKVKFFPRNAPGVFRVALSPLESFEFVNQLGQPIYEMVVRDNDRNQWVKPEIYSYPLFVCTRPEMLQRGTAT